MKSLTASTAPFRPEPDEGEVSEGEESEDSQGTEDSSTSSDTVTDIKKLEAESVVMEGKAKLHALERDSQAL